MILTPVLARSAGDAIPRGVVRRHDDRELVAGEDDGRAVGEAGRRRASAGWSCRPTGRRPRARPARSSSRARRTSPSRCTSVDARIRASRRRSLPLSSAPLQRGGGEDRELDGCGRRRRPEVARRRRRADVAAWPAALGRCSAARARRARRGSRRTRDFTRGAPSGRLLDDHVGRLHHADRLVTDLEVAARRPPPRS